MVGNTYHWSIATNSGLEAVGPYRNGASVWINAETFRKIADPYVHVEAVYTVNNWVTQTGVPLERNGTNGNNDLWHKLIGSFNSSNDSVNVKYYIHAWDDNPSSADLYDNNNGANYSFTVQAPPYVTIDYPQENEVIISPVYTIRIGASASTNNVRVKIDTGDWSQCYFASGYWWFVWANYPAGTHQMISEGWDVLGQRSETLVRHCSYAP